MDGPAFEAVRCYLRELFAGQYARASAALDEAIATEGLGTINGAFADAGRTLLDGIRFPAGTIDVLAEIELLATRVVDITVIDATEEERAIEIEHQTALIVFLGSEGLPCAARATVASWTPVDRHEALVRATVGLGAIVAERCAITPGAVIDVLETPGVAEPALGTFSLAWRDEHGHPSVLSGALPRGQTANITFLGSGTVSLRSVFARVAYLATPRADAAGMRQSLGTTTDH